MTMPTIGFTVLVVLLGCLASNVAAAKRAASGSIAIGVVWDLNDRMFWRSVDMAVGEINHDGGVLGRQLRLVRRDDQNDVTTGMDVAQSFVDSGQVVAVIGHGRTYVALPAAAIYDRAGLPYIAFSATSPKLTQMGYRTVFQAVPNDTQSGSEMARYAAQKGYKRTVVYYSPDAYGRGLAAAFEDAANALGDDVVDRISYFSDESQVRQLVQRWRAFGYDSVFVAGVMPTAGQFISMLRSAGVQVPIIGGDGLANCEFLALPHSVTEGVVAVTPFDPASPDSLMHPYVQAYRARYGADPDPWGAMAYDSIKVLASAIKQADSASPAAIVDALKALEGWRGVTGPISFSSTGALVGKEDYLVQVHDGRFVYLPSPTQTASPLSR